MSVVKEKKFVMKHVFHDVMNMKENKECYGKEERHFKVPWAISIYYDKGLSVFLECQYTLETNDWSIGTDIELKLFKKGTEESFFVENIYREDDGVGHTLENIKIDELQDYLVDGNLTVECHVKITKTTGPFKEKLTNFDESMKEFSDVVLVVNDEKFYVCKMHLASHSPYFKSLFSANFNESQQSEIILNDIDPYDFQDFLELIHGDSDVEDDNVFGILKLADMYDAKVAIRRCEEFLIERSKHSLKGMFDAAVTYKLEKLKEKCMSEMTSSAHVWSVVPEDATKLDHSTWKELLRLSTSFK